MASSVKSRSNFYETLQLAPGASSEEIVRAFSAQMRSASLRPDITVARMAELSVAYETLRDPAKRRAYDVSLGVRAEPAPPPPPSTAPFIGAALIDRLNRVAEVAPNPAAQPTPPAAPERPQESRVAQFIAASLREPAKQPEPEPSPAPPAAPLQTQERDSVAPPPTFREDEGMMIEDGGASIGRTGAILAASVVGVAILAFVVALPSRNPDRLDAPAAEEQSAVTIPLPPATAAADSPVAPRSSASEAAPAPRALRATRPGSTLAMKAKAVPPASPDQARLAEAASDQAPLQSPSVEPAKEQAGSEPALVQTAADTLAEADVATGSDPARAPASNAKLPLPNATIARTIERIGYRCGRVVSTSAVEGAAGVYNIACASGDSYRATPLHGRYHFRRSGR
jgi:DnaJ-like protein